MKKHVPDPPYTLHTLPGLSREDAMRHAVEYLDKALANVARLPEPSMEHEMQMLSDALIDMKVSKAMMTVAVAASTLSVPV